MKRKFLSLLAACLCAALLAAPAYAQSNETEAAPAESKPEEKASNPFTPKGTGTVVDEATDEDGKEFYTITTPEENVFFLIIDKQRDTENVYFLNTVTESDLLALAEKDSDTAVPEPPVTVEPVPQPVEPETPEEPEQPQKSSSPFTLVLIGAAVLAAGGLGYYFKIYKPKHELDDADDLDMFPFDGPEEPTVREDELLTEEEDAERRRQYEEGWDDDEGDADAPVQ